MFSMIHYLLDCVTSIAVQGEEVNSIGIKRLSSLQATRPSIACSEES